jgi:hypothetical protein
LGKVDIKDTTPEELGDFLRAISPKQELPNRGFYGDFHVLKPNLQHPMFWLYLNWLIVANANCCATIVNFI